MVSRRNFFRIGLGAAATLLLAKCLPAKKNKIKVTFKPSSSSRGHEVWKNSQSLKQGPTIEKKVVVIGGGIAGLSAAYHLQKSGIKDIIVLELDDKAGGNSVSGSNAYSEYPYGAHYLTLPDPANRPLISFLHEKKIITGFDEKGRPVFNETDLCFDPEERLWMRGTFQAGLVPAYGISEEERAEMSRFSALMEKFRDQKGNDGNYFFAIPKSLCSSDESLDHLDAISFADFLRENGFTGPALSWYLDYCCRDDYGGGTEKVSAWAGINYFAARRADPSNTDAGRVLTWPEGNGRLVKLLGDDVKDALRTGCLVKKIDMNGDKLKIECLDFKNNAQFGISCDHCIAAIPPFVLSHIIDKNIRYPFEKAAALKHSPWLVAAVTLSEIPQGRGVGLCWDNVAYKASSLGYVYDQHQQLSPPRSQQVISFYMPFDHADLKQARKEMEKRSAEEWEKIVVDELEIMHPGIEKNIEAIEICLWGHGMILPGKGVSRGAALKELSAPIDGKLFFAHSDLAAYSTFEEAFDQGYQAAQQIKTKMI